MYLDLYLYIVGPKTGAYHRKCKIIFTFNTFTFLWMISNFVQNFKVNNIFALDNKINMDQLQDIMNIYQDLGITIIKEKINAWYPIKLQNSHEPFEMGKV